MGTCASQRLSCFASRVGLNCFTVHVRRQWAAILDAKGRPKSSAQSERQPLQQQGQNAKNPSDAAEEALGTCASQRFSCFASRVCSNCFIVHVRRQWVAILKGKCTPKSSVQSERQPLQQHSANRKVLYTLIYGVVDFARPRLAAGSPVQCQKN